MLGYTWGDSGVIPQRIQKQMCPDVFEPFRSSVAMRRKQSKSDDLLGAAGRRTVFQCAEIEQLVPMLESKLATVRLAALLQLEDSIEKREQVSLNFAAIERLFELMKDKSLAIVMTACSVLEHSQDVGEAWKQIGDMFLSKSDDVRISTLRLAVVHGKKMPLLETRRIERLLADSDLSVAAAAVETVEALELPAELVETRALRLLRRVVNSGEDELMVRVCGALSRISPDVVALSESYFDGEELPSVMELMGLGRTRTVEE